VRAEILRETPIGFRVATVDVDGVAVPAESELPCRPTMTFASATSLGSAANGLRLWTWCPGVETASGALPQPEVAPGGCPAFRETGGGIARRGQRCSDCRDAQAKLAKRANRKRKAEDDELAAAASAESDVCDTAAQRPRPQAADGVSVTERVQGVLRELKELGMDDTSTAFVYVRASLLSAITCPALCLR
jgi:hypothetical protein